MDPPPIERQLTLSRLPHIQRVLGDDHLVLELFDRFAQRHQQISLACSCRFLHGLKRLELAALRRERRAELLRLTYLAGQTDRRLDAFRYALGLTLVIMVDATDDPVTPEERQTLAEAFMFRAASFRSSLRITSSIKMRQQEKDPMPEYVPHPNIVIGGYLPDLHRQHALAAAYHSEVVAEYVGVCACVAAVASQLAGMGCADDRCYFHTMSASYQGHAADYAADREQHLQAAVQAFGAARVAAAALPIDNATRLSLVLRHSAFLYEKLGQHRAACDMLQKDYDEALAMVDWEDENRGQDRGSIMMMQCVRDSLNLWSAERDETTTPAPVIQR